MPRAAKRDPVATEAAQFECPDSFIGFDGHEYLEGKDRTKRRRQVWERDGRRCVRCGKYVRWKNEAEMDHRKGGLYGRCDCLTCDRHGDGKGNLQTLCAECHRGPEGKHPGRG